jgi:L-threonylcarbamoyladenylate synthase
VHGIESTIIAVLANRIDILRRGPITAEQLSEFGTIHIAVGGGKISAPGQLATHYAPKTPLRLIDSAKTFKPKEKQRVGLLAWNAFAPEERRFAAVRTLSEHQDLREAAANLFRSLRELDDLDLDLIVAERVPAQRLGAAILDRLERASHGSDN